MHLGCDGPREGAGGGVWGPEPGIWMPFCQRFGHGEAVEDHDAVFVAHDRHKACGVQIGQILGHGAIIKSHHVRAVGQVELAKHQPTAHGPAGEGTVTDEEIVGQRREVRLVGLVTPNADLLGCASRTVIDGFYMPAIGAQVQFSDRKVVELVAECLVRGDLKGPLHLG